MELQELKVAIESSPSEVDWEQLDYQHMYNLMVFGNLQFVVAMEEAFELEEAILSTTETLRVLEEIADNIIMIRMFKTFFTRSKGFEYEKSNSGTGQLITATNTYGKTISKYMRGKADIYELTSVVADFEKCIYGYIDGYGFNMEDIHKMINAKMDEWVKNICGAEQGGC